MCDNILLRPGAHSTESPLPRMAIRHAGRKCLGLLSALTLVCFGLGFAQQSLAAAAPALPNFVIIFADDMGYGDIGPFGSKLNRTPNLDRMAREGMKLTSFYAAPVCTPSRAQIITGCYAQRVSLPRVLFPASPIGLNTNEATIASLLKQQGYATLAIGKWHLGDQREFLPTQHGFDHYFGLPYSNDMGLGEAAASAAAGQDAPPITLDLPGPVGITGRRRPPLPLVRDGQAVESVSDAAQDSLTERYTAEAVEFIRKHQKEKFFLYLAHTAVHVPLHPGSAFRGQSRNGAYGDWVEELDGSAGRVLDTLRELKLDGKTLVVFTSDNGPWLSQGKDGGSAGPLRGGKGSTWEGGVREPTLVWWPGQVRAGSSCNQIMANFDLLPTFVKLAGGTVPKDRKLDGVDLWPLLSGADSRPVHEAYFYFTAGQLQAVRSGPWKLAVANQPGLAQEETSPRLYNLENDIGERTNVAALHPERVARLQQLLAAMEDDLGREGKGSGVREPGRALAPEPLKAKGTKVVFAEEPARRKARPAGSAPGSLR